MFQIGDWVTQYSVGYWQVVDIKAKYAEEDSGYGKQFWKKGEQIGKWVFLKKAFTPKMKIQIRSECVDGEWCKIVTDEKRTEIKKYFADHPNDWERFCNTPVVIPPAVSSIWMNLSDDQEAKVLQILKELHKCFSRAELDQQFEQRGLLNVVTNPPTSHILSLSCNPWEVGANVDLMYFSPELKRV